MVALSGMFGSLHVAQQPVHLVNVQPAAGAHRTVTGNCRANRMQFVGQRETLSPLSHFAGQIANQRLYVTIAEQCRNFTDNNRRRTELLNGQA